MTHSVKHWVLIGRNFYTKIWNYHNSWIDDTNAPCMLHVEEESLLSMLESAEVSRCLDSVVLPTLVRRLTSSRKCWTLREKELTNICVTVIINYALRYVHIIKRWWYSGEHSCLPSSWPGFDSRPSQIFLPFRSIPSHPGIASSAALTGFQEVSSPLTVL